jgi:addiction module RelE/StbE family toxin
MIIDFHKKFLKKYRKLPHSLQLKVNDVLERFEKNPFDIQLRNHPLKGVLKDRRAISVTGDMRVIFREYDKYTLVLMLDVGNHSQIYSH